MQTVQVPAGPPFDLVFFDCDSTLSAVEGIDELARRAGVHSAVAPLTAAAMDGQMTLDQVYAQRLQLLRPHKNDIGWLGDRYLEAIVPGATQVVAALQHMNKPVHIISGGLRAAILPLAEHLAIAPERVHAVELYWDSSGSYLDFDHGSPLTQSLGKAQLCGQVVPAGQRAALVGDGGTDVEAAQAGIYVIGFGGVVSRPNVAAQAQRFVTSRSLMDCLPYLLSAEERHRCELAS